MKMQHFIRFYNNTAAHVYRGTDPADMKYIGSYYMPDMRSKDFKFFDDDVTLLPALASQAQRYASELTPGWTVADEIKAKDRA